MAQIATRKTHAIKKMKKEGYAVIDKSDCGAVIMQHKQFKGFRCEVTGGGMIEKFRQAKHDGDCPACGMMLMKGEDGERCPRCEGLIPMTKSKRIFKPELAYGI